MYWALHSPLLPVCRFHRRFLCSSPNKTPKINVQGKMILKWTVGKKVATGGFGEIYTGLNKKDNERVVIKIDKNIKSKNAIQKEAEIYRILGKTETFPEMKWSGKINTTNGNISVLVMDSLGLSLSRLLKQQKGKFSLKTVLMLGDQMLTCIENLHKKGIVHGDIKPGNFVMGIGPRSHTVFLIDFGLAVSYMVSTPATLGRLDTHVPIRENIPFKGTFKYVSVNMHNRIEQSRRDDLESLGYVLINFLKGGLPWSGIKKGPNMESENIIKEMKIKLGNSITDGLPDEFERYLINVKRLQFEEEPNYQLLHQLLRKCLERNSLQFDFVYDWTTKTRANVIQK